MSRRKMLKGIGIAGAAIAVSPAVLAACGDDSGSSAATTAGGGGAATTAAGGAATTGAGAAGDVGATLAKLLGIDAATSGNGMDFKMGNVLALTGTGSFYGKTMTRGIDLAVKHIEAAGGPNINVIYHDHKSGDAAAGKDGHHRARCGQGCPAKLASYVDDLGVMLDGTAAVQDVHARRRRRHQHRSARASRYFWGTRAITPNDPLPGLFKYTKETFPDAKTVGLTGWDIGEPNNGIIKADVLKKIADGGYQFNGLYELCPVGTQDFSAVLPKIKANEPDILLLGGYGQDPGFFLNQSATAGLKAKIIGFEFTPDGVNASKGTYDRVGWTFAYDYFDADNPKSPLAKLFVDGVQEGVRRGPRLLRRQLLREHVGDVGGHPPGAGQEAATSRRHPARQGAAGQPHRRQRLRRRREHRRHVHARPDHPLGDQARDGRVRVQGREGHAEGLLRHRRRRLPTA